MWSRWDGRGGFLSDIWWNLLADCLCSWTFAWASLVNENIVQHSTEYFCHGQRAKIVLIEYALYKFLLSHRQTNLTNHVAPFEVDNIQYPPPQIISTGGILFNIPLWRHTRICIYTWTEIIRITNIKHTISKIILPIQFAKSRRQPLRLFNLFCFNNFSRKWWLIIIAIVKYNLLTILKLQHDISRPCYRPIIKVQNPNLRIFSPLSPCLLSPIRLNRSSLCDKTIIE